MSNVGKRKQTPGVYTFEVSAVAHLFAHADELSPRGFVPKFNVDLSMVPSRN